ncbi:hypothetical protein M406DRAFT_261952 [Cryphonectria parasitica EP155]|uniref:Uncharacterized protein n=1 Tax=Cryphonectria parasitica (strain ATCC 38755 / EP155) TaxID=660469 RepID=A0A9P4XYU2_CRYP1|nr:uncharacterized protein M406DRAFT_261952 [Cryphonectria parasitica EP155]KAF3763513.1 hypothetical protein M406DRAFT_261952 [Cryphonectria parasitica EP155]
MDYSNVILQANSVPAYYNIAAVGALCSVLSGVLVLPGTFTSLQKSESFLQHIPLLPVSAIFCCAGLAGVAYL